MGIRLSPFCIYFHKSRPLRVLSSSLNVNRASAAGTCSVSFKKFTALSVDTHSPLAIVTLLNLLCPNTLLIFLMSHRRKDLGSCPWDSNRNTIIFSEYTTNSSRWITLDITDRRSHFFPRPDVRSTLFKSFRSEFQIPVSNYHNVAPRMHVSLGSGTFASDHAIM